jgi:nicotinate-nucleotide pyrophosphorylase (carboxylating)
MAASSDDNQGERLRHGADIAAVPAVARLIELALDEDLGRGDVTSTAVQAELAGPARGAVVARGPLVACGIDVAVAVFHKVDAALEVQRLARDGDELAPGEVLLEVRGDPASILGAERTALNFLQRLSGVATMARRFARAVAGTRARVVDTRKTTPGYRLLEKLAVRAGGCFNHRFDLGSGVLIKDNHVAVCGSVAVAVQRARERAPHPLRIEVEVDTLEQLDEAMAAGAEVLLVDNMSPAEVARAVERAHARGVLVEASGGIGLHNIAEYAATGVDFISAGALTHSAPAVDIALDLL